MNFDSFFLTFFRNNSLSNFRNNSLSTFSTAAAGLIMTGLVAVDSSNARAQASTPPCGDPDIQLTAPSWPGASDGTWTKDGVTMAAKNPLAEALKNAAPGERIQMGPGQYLGVQLGKTGWSHYQVPTVLDVDVCGTSADDVEIERVAENGKWRRAL